MLLTETSCSTSGNHQVTVKSILTNEVCFQNERPKKKKKHALLCTLYRLLVLQFELIAILWATSYTDEATQYNCSLE